MVVIIYYLVIWKFYLYKHDVTFLCTSCVHGLWWLYLNNIFQLFTKNRFWACNFLFSSFQYHCGSYQSKRWSALFWTLWGWLQSTMAWPSFQNSSYYHKAYGCSEPASRSFIFKDAIPARCSVKCPFLLSLITDTLSGFDLAWLNTDKLDEWSFV